MTAIDNREFYCDDCLSKYSTRKDAKEITQKSRDMKGCFGVKKTAMHKIVTDGGKSGIQFSTCIGNFFDLTVLSLLEMQRQYEKGILPFKGSLAEQPNKVIEAFGVIEKYKYDKAERERQLRQLKERGKRGG